MKDFKEQIIEDAIDNLNRQIESVFIEGLKNKGYDLSGMPQNKIESFVKNYCSVVDCIESQTKTYYVKNIPFLIWNYEQNIKFDIHNMPLTFKADYGTYCFV